MPELHEGLQKYEHGHVSGDIPEELKRRAELNIRELGLKKAAESKAPENESAYDFKQRMEAYLKESVFEDFGKVTEGIMENYARASADQIKSKFWNHKPDIALRVMEEIIHSKSQPQRNRKLAEKILEIIEKGNVDKFKQDQAA